MPSTSTRPLAHCRCREEYSPNRRCTARHHHERSPASFVGGTRLCKTLAARVGTRESSSSSLFQQPQEFAPDIFSDLLLNPGRLYGRSPISSSRGTSRISVARTSGSLAVAGSKLQRRLSPPLSLSTIPKKEEEEQEGKERLWRSTGLPDMLPRLRGMAPVSSRTRKAATKTPAAKKEVPKTKSDTKSKKGPTRPIGLVRRKSGDPAKEDKGESNVKKRTLTATAAAGPAKKQKTEPNVEKPNSNVKKKENGVKSAASKEDPIVIDSDTESSPSNARASNTATRDTGIWPRLSGDSEIVKLDSSDTEAKPDIPLRKQSYLEKKVARLETQHAADVQRLRKEVEDAKAEANRVRLEMQKKIDDAELQRASLISQADEKYASIARDLACERTKATLLKEERDTLVVEVEAGKTRCTNLVQEVQGQRRVNEQARKEHAHHEALAKTKTSELSTLRDENTCLRNDLATLHTDNTRLQHEVESQTAAAAALASQTSTTSAPSPAPSSSTCTIDEDIKTDNVRKTYVKVKRRFDTLHVVAVNIARCTRGMDLTSFGEFGKYARQLKTVLEEDGVEKQGVLVRRGGGEVDHRFGV